MKASKILLFPYWLTLKIRHRLYDEGKLRSYAFPVPVISVGNATVGGTGKTPMTEYLLRALLPEYRVAVLSMGYKRRSRGFRIVESGSTAEMAGDEPLQIKRKFPQATVAVDRNRRRGIQTLLMLPSPPEVILLDDGFQRREILPRKNLFLIDCYRPLSRDELLPLGRLRDLPERMERADAIIFTKCPDWIDDSERAALLDANDIPGNKPVFFTKTAYCQPLPVFEGEGNNRYIYAREVILFTGIAHPGSLVSYLEDRYDYIERHTYPDHHYFSRKDILKLWHRARIHPLSVLMTTEKDAQRLLHNPHIPKAMKQRLYYLPVQTQFLDAAEEADFLRLVKD